MFYVDRYFVILFCLLHFPFQRDLVSVSLVYFIGLHRNTYTHRLYMYVGMYVCVCAVIPHTIEPLKITAREIPSLRQP